MRSGIQINDNLSGPLFMLLSCVLFSIMGGLIRYLSIMDFHPFMTAFLRTLLAIVFLMPTFYKVGIFGLKTNQIKLHFFRGIVSAIAVISSFYAVTVIPLASATSYSFAAPVISTLLAVIFLKERIHLPRISAIIAGFIGMVILLRPGTVPFSLGVGAALTSAFAVAFAIICIRKLSQADKPNVVALYAMFFTLPISFVFALTRWSWPSPHQWSILILIGLCAALAQYSISRAFSRTETTAIMPIDFTRLIFAAIIGYVFYEETPDIYTFIGGTIILSSAVYAAHREAKRRKNNLL
ncbi:MAG: DMT family transporter [Kordiimonadaceae bacterium]|nr:DMT family transporter [Kordiimonadaceae bacterium]MDB4043917.1 DMT family transporter [Emcibacteraceae bacterium]MBT6134304.1 DMT family transporter [Kordiimonadaceae bacterium]MBT6467169.1 DMT family transporter [Kordiimonadaceae bacterium]MBT7544861.1 DMT family transporter [Kordiimonadaceae bacterium]